MYNKEYYNQLANAYFLLFGSYFRIYKETPNYLEINKIKSAYREKAKLYHPDTSNLSEEEISNNFNELNSAYKLLISYIGEKIKLKNYNNYFYILNNNFNKL